MEIVERLQYTPNPNSRRLLSKRTNNIAVLFKSDALPLDHFYYSELTCEILKECERQGYNLIFASIRINGDQIVLPQVVCTYDVDGIIIYGDMETAVLGELRQYDIPFVLVDCHEVVPGVTCVHVDYAAAALAAVEYLIQCGHHDIAYLGGGNSPGFGAQTFSGFCRALELHQITIPLKWIQNSMRESDENLHVRCLEHIFSSKPYPTALFCAADLYAINAIRFLKGKGLRVPEDVSVIGIDDILLARYVEPKLTTVRVDNVAMGRAALSSLLRRIGKQHVNNTVINPGDLIERDSVRALS